MTKNIFALLLFILVVFSVSAQEVLTSPSYNPSVAKQSQQKFVKASSTPLKLPFYDDFSVNSVYPSTSRWADKYAFINTDFAKFPPSIGVATLDALDENGNLYANAGKFQFDADELTSLPIRLDSIFLPSKKAISCSDSIYLSFYYQPQGRSVSPPSKTSSLILEFHSPMEADSVWNIMWSTDGGISIDSFAQPNKKYFRQILIPITSKNDSALYYKNGFRFRFRNIAALYGNELPDWRSNGSNWNIDVVNLSDRRKISDTVISDIAFGELAPSMLKNCESMPFRQYRNNYIKEMKDTLDIKISNLDIQSHNVSYKYEVRMNSGVSTIVAPYDAGSFSILPYFNNGYSNYQKFARPEVNLFFPPTSDQSIIFHILHTLSPDPNPLYRSNDSTQFDQIFSNYYAYDNGSSEAGIGINGVGSYAVQFKLNVSDTLRGMQIYFNPVVGNINEKMINLEVRNDAYGKPGQVIQALNNITPIFPDNLNEYTTYWFENPVVVNSGTFPGLIFYIGWSQSFVDNMNVGFDRYKDSHSKRFYNVTGSWLGSDSINYGSVMMRPIIGYKNPLDIENPTPVQKLSFSPNPVTNGVLNIQIPESWKSNFGNNLNISILTATGSQVLSGVFTNPVNVSSLSSGFYMVVLTDKNSGLKATGKLIIR